MFATVLTLLFTPAALMARANYAAWRKRRRHRYETSAPPVVVARAQPEELRTAAE